jgi:hypothetical protein
MIYDEQENSILFTSEKGGAGKSALLSNITSIISYQFDQPVLVIDADVTNHSTTRMLLSTVSTKELIDLENKGMVLTTETLANGLFKEKSPLILPDDIIDPANMVNKLTDINNPVSKKIFGMMSEDAQKMFATIDNRTNSTFSLLADTITGEMNHIMEKDSLYDEQTFADIELSQETNNLINSVNQARKNGITIDNRMIKKLNRSLMLDTYPNNITRGMEFTPESAFKKLSFKATPRANVSPQTLFTVPSKGRTKFDHRFNPMEISDDMNTINDGFLSLYDHVFYDTEATSNVLKTSLFEMENVELVSVITPHNIDVELDMLSAYENMQIKGVLLNSETPEKVHDHVDEIRGHGYPLISVIPFDTHMSEKMLHGNMSLVVGDGSNLDYIIRIAALNLLKLNALDNRQIDKIFTDPKSVYEELSEKMFVGRNTNNKKQKKSSDDQEDTKSKSKSNGGFFSKISGILGSSVNK